jgi:uncharacterized protein (DUF1778 family)
LIFDFVRQFDVQLRKGETMATDSKRRPARGRLPKPARLNARLTGSQKQLLEHAATLTGRSLTDFVVSTAEDAAGRTIREHEIMTLSARDSEVFAAALLGTPRATPRLAKAAERYRGLASPGK